MRKNQDGYILIYVLVIILVMGIVTAGIMSLSIGNLHAQKVAGQQMQELYEAEGIAEQLVAEIGAQSCELIYVQKNAEGFPITDGEGNPVLDPIDLSKYDDPSEVKEVNRNTLIATANDLISKIESLSNEKVSINLVEIEDPTVSEGERRMETIKQAFETYYGTTATHTVALPISLTAKPPEGNTRVEAQLEIIISLSLATKREPMEDGEKTWLNGALAKVIDAQYTSYEISTGVSE